MELGKCILSTSSKEMDEGIKTYVNKSKIRYSFTFYKDLESRPPIVKASSERGFFESNGYQDCNNRTNSCLQYISRDICDWGYPISGNEPLSYVVS